MYIAFSVVLANNLDTLVLYLVKLLQF